MMVAKPAAQTILSTFTLDELIDLVKDKAQMEVDEKLNEAKDQLVSFFGEASSKPAAVQKTIKTVKKGKRGRPPMAAKAPKVESDTPRGRGRGKKLSLGGFLLQALTNSPQNIESIMSGLKTVGYKSSAKDPRRILYLELNKQVKKGNAIKTDRGMYALKK